MNYSKGLLSDTKPDRSNLICLLLLVAYLLPLIILRENSYISIYDNLDSFFIYGLVLKQSGTIFADGSTIVPNIMNGIPRSFYPTGINVYMLLIYFFNNILDAYIVNAVIVHFIAYIGMHRLLTIINSQENYKETDYTNFFKAFVSLCFAILPYQTNYGLSIAGIPLILSGFAGLLISPQRRWLNYLCIALFPLYCINIFITPFFLAPLALFGAYSYVKRKNYYYNHFVYGILLLVALFIIVDWQLLCGALGGEKVKSHRYDFHLDKYYPSIFSIEVITEMIIAILGRFVLQIKFPEYCLQLGIIISLVVLFIMTKKIESRTIKILLLVNFLICIFWSFHYTYEFQIFKNQFGMLRGYHLSRFSFLAPTFWYIIFFLALKEIYERTKKIVLCRILIALQIVVIILGHLQVTMVGKRVIGYTKNTEKEITYNQFFSPALFSQIKEYIGKPTDSYRIACVGFFSSIALYNGFYTLDNYQNNYPLDYKVKFRKVIANELEKSEPYKKDFDYWGHYCFIRSSEIPFGKQGLIHKTSNYKINNLDINVGALKDIKCNYIFSAVEIRNYQQLHMSFLKSFEREDSPWRIYVYQLL